MNSEMISEVISEFAPPSVHIRGCHRSYACANQSPGLQYTLTPYNLLCTNSIKSETKNFVVGCIWILVVPSGWSLLFCFVQVYGSFTK